MKVLAFVCGALLLMLVGGLVAARYFFPEEAIRRQLEQVLSQQLHGTVRVASLKWDLFTGIRLGPVEVERSGARFAEFDDLMLRYNLWHLLHGELVIEELVLKQAGVFIALQASATAPDQEPPSEPSGSPTLPSLPLAIDLRSVRILDSEVAVTRDDGVRLALHHVNLSAGLSAGPKRADVSGTLDVADIEVALSEQQWRLPLHIEFAVSADLPEERLRIDRVEISSEPILKLSLSGQIDHVVSSREMTLSVQEGRIDLERLVAFGRPFLPPHLTDMHLAGTISPAITIKGSQTGKGFDGTVGADLTGVDVRGAVPAFKVVLEPTSFRVTTDETLVRANRPRAIRADVSIDSTSVSMGASSLRNFALGVQATHTDSGQLSGHVTVTGKVSAALPPPIQPLSEPVELEIDLSGDEHARSFSLRKAKARVGQLLELHASGEVGSMKEASAERPFVVETVIETDVTKLVRAFPHDAVRGVGLASRSGRQKLKVKLRGTLDPEFRPQRATADVSLDMSGLHAASTEADIAGTLDRLGVEIQATYGAKTGSLTGTFSGFTGLTDLKQGTSLALGAAALKFHGKLNSRVTPEMAFSRLMASNQLELETRHIRFAGSGVTGQLDRMTVSSEIEADVTEGAYKLSSLRVIVQDLLDCAINGEFRSKSQQFSVDLSIPSFNVAKLRNHLLGPDVQALAEVAPAGRLSVKAGGSGTVPRAEQIAALRLPVAAFMNLELHDVAGAFRDHRVTGANGTVHISLEPSERDQILSSLKVEAKRVDVGGGLPIKQLKELSIDFAASVENFNSLTLDRLAVSAEGAEVTLEGEVSGVKRILTTKGMPLFAQLGPLFVKVRSNATFDLDRFADVVRSYGIDGSGHAGFDLSLLKRERGVLDVRLSLLPRRLSLTKDANQVEELDGAIEVRKVLQWLPALGDSSPDASFSPTGRLPDLRTSILPRHDLRIRRIETGGIQVRELSAGLFFDRDRFVLQDLAMTVLGGGLGGEVVLNGGRGFGLTTRLEASRLDMNRLFPPGEQIQGDSLIDGTLTLTAVFDATSGRLDFGQSKMDLSLSRIGRDTLDRVLRFLDPKGSNPSIVGARSAVKLANPSSARVTLSKGLVGLQILFQEGLLARFAMDRIPVSQVKQVQNLTQTIPQWDMIRGVMEVLGAHRYGVDQEGAFVLQ